MSPQRTSQRSRTRRLRPSPLSTSQERRPFFFPQAQRLAARHPGTKVGPWRPGQDTVVGLKIGASQIAAAVVTETDGSYELVQLARRPIDRGLVVDGEVRDADALAHQLRMFFEENELPRKDVRIGLASNRIGVRTFDIAGIDDEAKFDNAVRFKAHEVLAGRPARVGARLPRPRGAPTEDGERRGGSSSSSPRGTRSSPMCTSRGRRASGSPASTSRRSACSARSSTPQPPGSRSTTRPPWSSRSATSPPRCSSPAAGACEFTRVFDWGGRTLQHAMTQELDVHPAEAATILRHLSLSGPGRRTSRSTKRRAPGRSRPSGSRLTPFARELVSSLQFYQTQPDSLGIGEIVITGGTSHLEGLGDALHQMIGVTVRVGDPLARVNVEHALDPAIEATIGSLAVPIGLAIEDDARAASTCSRPTSAGAAQAPESRCDRVAGRGRRAGRGARLHVRLGTRRRRATRRPSSTPSGADRRAAGAQRPVSTPRIQGDAAAARAGCGERARQPGRLGRGAP